MKSAFTAEKALPQVTGFTSQKHTDALSDLREPEIIKGDGENRLP